MSRTLTASGLESIHAQETGDVWCAIIELSHSSWGSTVRLVNNGEAVTHDGNTYQPFPFTVTLPDESEEGLPVLEWNATNVSRELIPELRTAAATAGYIDARIAWLRANDPTTLEVGWMDLEIRSINYDANILSGNLTVEPILDAQFAVKRFTPANAPGLF